MSCSNRSKHNLVCIHTSTPHLDSLFPQVGACESKVLVVVLVVVLVAVLDVDLVLVADHL